ncbi:MAG: hypothetical protein WDO15_09525 [Bacteroidota bacterium]
MVRLDWLGFDGGTRDLPSNFPATADIKNSNRASDLRETAGKSLTNNFALNKVTARPDMGFNFTTSQNFRVGGIKLSNVTSVAYSNSFTHYSSDLSRYNSFDTDVPGKRFQYQDQSYSNDVRVNVMHNWTARIDERNKIEFKNLFVQLGEDKTTIRRRPGLPSKTR